MTPLAKQSSAFWTAAVSAVLAAVFLALFVQQPQPQQQQQQPPPPQQPQQPQPQGPASVDEAPASPPPAEADESLPELTCDPVALFEWLREGGAFIHPAIALRSSASTAVVCRRAASTGDAATQAGQEPAQREAELEVYLNGTAIGAGGQLFSVPEVPFALSAAAVSAGSNASLLRGTEGMQLRLASSFIADEAGARAYLSLAVALLCERRRAQRGASRWEPYLGCLPAVSDCPALLCFNKHERKALQVRIVSLIAFTFSRSQSSADPAESSEV
jgi:hypothetical protein